MQGIKDSTPTNRDLEKRSFDWHLVLLPLVVVASGLMTKILGKFYNDSDPIWSMALGKWIDMHHAIPRVDYFSWTIYSKPWVTGEWLFCWLIYKVNHFAGNWGTAFMMMLVYLTASYYIFAICRRSTPGRSSIWIAAIGSWAIVLFSAVPRALIFTFAFLAIQTYIMRFKKNSLWLYTLPLLFLVWANIQNTAVFGVAILVFEAIVGTFVYKEKTLWPVIGLSLMASLINPAGIHMWTDVIRFMGLPENKSIMEWKAPDFNNKIVVLSFLFFAATGLWVTLKSKFEELDHHQLMSIIWFWIAYLYSLTTVRGVDYTLFFWLILIASLTPQWIKNHLNVPPAFGSAVFGLILAILVVSISIAKLPIFRISPTIMPTGAVDYLKQHPDFQDRLFNEYIFGGYLTQEGIPVFIDARATPYIQSGVFKDYSRITGLKEPPGPIFRKYGVKTVLIEPKRPLAVYLASQRDWRIVYQDKTSIIFTKN
ncbi:MAG: hypothetical protein ACM3UZ_10820 [Acidobacteriota bacterium]